MGPVNGKRQVALFDEAAVGPFAGVVLNRPVEAILSYRVPERFRASIRPGVRVRIPLGRGNTAEVGYCVRVDEAPPDDVEPGRIKDVLDVLDDPPLIDAGMLELTRWMASYYACSWGQALDAVVPAGVKKAAGTAICGSFLTVATEEVKPHPRHPATAPQAGARSLAVLCKIESELLTLEDVCPSGSMCPTGPMAALLKQKGLINTLKSTGTEQGRCPRSRPIPRPSRLVPRWTLTAEQKTVALDAHGAVHSMATASAAFLLHGVTGSGKTEIYLESPSSAWWRRGREAIVLVPEISLTPQTIRRFRRRFKTAWPSCIVICLMWSGIGIGDRIAAGEIEVDRRRPLGRVRAGPPNLGLIVIDEEHESHVQAGARAHAIMPASVAMVRARNGGHFPCCWDRPRRRWRLGSNAELGRYTRSCRWPSRVA